MALEQELQQEEAKMDASKKEEKVEEKNFDDLTDEEIEAVKEMAAMPWWEIAKKCMEKRVKKQDENIVVLAKDNCFNPKQDWYTLFEVLWAFTQWMGEMERLVKVITADPEDIKKAQEAVQKAEAIMRGEKVEWVD